MKKIFSKEYMQDNCGCYRSVPLKIESIFFTGDNTEINIDGILQSDIPLIDKFWFITRKTELTVAQKWHIAISVAEIVLPLYELRYPDDARVRDCIETTKLFLTGHISIKTLANTKRAAYAAYAAYADYAVDAANAAYAAYAAADAATCAADAVDAAYAAATRAVYAASAAANAAYAAYAAADAATCAADAVDAAYAAATRAVYAASAAADYTEKLLNFLTEFVKNN